jgi:hypothetical protein
MVEEMDSLRVHGPAMLGVVLVAVVSLGADVALSEQSADSYVRKLQTIRENSLAESREPRVTSLHEAEINSYLKYRAGSQVPVGVLDPYLSIQGDGRIIGRATVDLDAVREGHRSTGWLDPMNLLGGRLPVTAVAVLTTSNGVGRVVIESADVSGIPIPMTLFQEFVSYYTRSADRPTGFNLGDPFDLPLRIRAINVESAEAVVVQ